MVQTYEKKDDGRLNTNFRVREFACKCSRCSEILIDDALVGLLQQIRDHFQVSVNINSGYRCAEHNAEVGGHPSSGHMAGKAADIIVKGIKPLEVAQYAESIGVKRIGLYDSFVHIGSGTAKRFWLGPEGKHVDTFASERYFTVELPVLRRGSKGDAVKALQAQLVGHGYDIQVDGSYGRATENAVKEFQTANGLTVDGVAGPNTCKKMLGVE